jgi:hypothetical protein
MGILDPVSPNNFGPSEGRVLPLGVADVSTINSVFLPSSAKAQAQLEAELALFSLYMQYGLGYMQYGLGYMQYGLGYIPE